MFQIPTVASTMQLVPENITPHPTTLSPPISVPASAHLYLPFNAPNNIQCTTPVNITSYETLGQGWDGSDDYLPSLDTGALVHSQSQSYSPYIDPGNYTTPTHEPPNGSNGVYLDNLGHNSLAGHYSGQPDDVPPTVLDSWVQPLEAGPSGSPVASEHDKSGTAIYGMGSGWVSEFSVGDDSFREWNSSHWVLDPFLPVTSVSASSFGTTDGSSRVSHELIRNEVFDLELTSFFQPASSVIGSGGDVGGNVGRHSQHRQWVCTQCHKSVRKADRVSHHLGHLNLKEWKCTCGSTFGLRCTGQRHVKEFTPCATCHKKIGRDGKGSFCKSCLVEDNALEMLVHHDKILAQICLIS